MNEIVLPADVVLFHVSPYDCWRTTYGGTSVTLDHIRTLRDHLDALERTLRPPRAGTQFGSPVNGAWSVGDLVQVDAAYDACYPGALAVVTDVDPYHVRGFPLTKATFPRDRETITWSKYHVAWCGMMQWPQLLWREPGNSKQK